MESPGRSHDGEEDRWVLRQRRISFLLTILIAVFLVAGVVNGIMMTIHNIRAAREETDFLRDNDRMMKELKRDLELGRREIEENRRILMERGPKLDRLYREVEEHRKIMESILRDRERPDSPQLLIPK